MSSGFAFVELDHQRAAGVADDVLGLVEVEVERQTLARLQNENLFAVRRAEIRLGRAVANVEHRDAAAIEVALTEVGTGPAEHVLENPVMLGSCIAPPLGG